MIEMSDLRFAFRQLRKSPAFTLVAILNSATIPTQIVGVVGDVRSRKVSDSDDIELYRPWAQENFPFLSIAVRSSLPVNEVTKSVRVALATVDPGLAIALPQSMNAIVAQALGQTRLMTSLLGIFAGVSVVAGEHRDLRGGRLHRRATHR